jgi:cardiolipin synthase A/B
MPAILLLQVSVSYAFFVAAVIAVPIMALMILVALFDPGLRYKISAPKTEKLDSDEFLYTLEAVTDAKVNHRSALQVLTNGDRFYEAELRDIGVAVQTVNLEAYIFQRGEIAGRFLAALAERARAGVKVNIVLDALGSAATRDSYVQELRDAGACVAWYHPVKWNKLPRYNNRTHRELLIVDGRTAYVGGAGIADQWYRGVGNKARWRDTMVRVEGDAVPRLQATFAENWLESHGEILMGAEYFPRVEAESAASVLVVNSTPSAGGATRARTLYQVLLASAQKTIDIATPYFLPDRSLSDEIVRAAERGVQVRIIVPGRHTDHILTRSSSRRGFGKLLKAGVQIFEYEAAMMHAKALMIDGLWSVVGSTNFDNRSFGLNDEVNLAVRDSGFNERLEEDFARDLANSTQMTYERWRRRPVLERAPELLGWVLERQQ